MTRTEQTSGFSVGFFLSLSGGFRLRLCLHELLQRWLLLGVMPPSAKVGITHPLAWDHPAGGAEKQPLDAQGRCVWCRREKKQRDCFRWSCRVGVTLKPRVGLSLKVIDNGGKDFSEYVWQCMSPPAPLLPNTWYFRTLSLENLVSD